MLTAEQRVSVANAQLDQLIASVRGDAPDLRSVRTLADRLLARPCNQTAAEHTEILAHNLALALFRLAEEDHGADL